MSKLMRRSPQALAARPLDHQEVRLKPAAIWSQAVVWTIIGTGCFGFIYAALAKIDEVVVATGELQPVGAARPIKAPVAGVLQEVLVKEGQSVIQGQPLLRFDPDVSAKRATTLSSQLTSERRRSSEEVRSILARLDSLRSRGVSLRDSLTTEQQILDQIEPLGREGGIQRMQILQQRNRVNQLRAEIDQSDANVREVEAQLLKMKEESLKEISNLERQQLEVRETQQYEVLRAPMAGQVFNLVAYSAGYAATPGETLVQIVPQGTLEAKVYLSTRDVGQLHPGQQAQVRIDAYPFTQYGSIPGSLKAIGTSSLPADQQHPEARYPAYVSLSRPFLERSGKRFMLTPGSTVQVNLILREKRVITLLTDAVEKAIDAMRRIRSGPG